MARLGCCGGRSKHKENCRVRIKATPEIEKACQRPSDTYWPISSGLGGMAEAMENLAITMVGKEEQPNVAVSTGRKFGKTALAKVITYQLNSADTMAKTIEVKLDQDGEVVLTETEV